MFSQSNKIVQALKINGCFEWDDYLVAAIMVMKKYENELRCSLLVNRLIKKIEPDFLQSEKSQNIWVELQETDRKGLCDCLIYLLNIALMKCTNDSKSDKTSLDKNALSECLDWVEKASKGEVVILEPNEEVQLNFQEDSIPELFQLMNVFTSQDEDGSMYKDAPLFLVFFNVPVDHQLVWRAWYIDHIFKHFKTLLNEKNRKEIPDMGYLDRHIQSWMEGIGNIYLKRQVNYSDVCNMNDSKTAAINKIQKIHSIFEFNRVNPSVVPYPYSRALGR